jgi:phage shock protein PspC (stress-responsive transcriptional regulator)
MPKGEMKMSKQLYKARDNRMLAGVCGGIGEYFAVDPTLIRLVAVFTGVFGVGLVGYILAALIIPSQPVSY